jgi:hypothetical protein
MTPAYLLLFGGCGMQAMARPKKKAPGGGAPKMTTRGLRMTSEYAKWIDEFATSERMGVATLIDRAVADYAKRAGFKTPPGRVL